MSCIPKLWDLQTKARPGTVEKMISEEVGRRSFMNSNFFDFRLSFPVLADFVPLSKQSGFFSVKKKLKKI